MKKIIWGLLGIIFAFASLIYVSSNKSNSVVNASNSQVDFAGPNNRFDLHADAGVNGIFIVRDVSVDSNATVSDADVFNGNMFLDDTLAGGQNITYEAVKRIGGVWYTAGEYYNYLGQSIGGVQDWFYVEQNTNLNSCIWQLRKKSPAGFYAIRVTIDGQIYYYEILYGTPLTYIMCFDDNNKSVCDYKKDGKNVKINVVVNAGAMQTDIMNVSTDGTQDFTAGLLSVSLDIYWQNISVNIKLNGKNVLCQDVTNAATSARNSKAIQYVREPGNIRFVNLAGHISGGRYVVEFSHLSAPTVLGTYIIDNGDRVASPISFGAAGTVLVVLGLLLLIITVALLLLPRIAYAINQKKYKTIEDKIYKTDKKSVKEQEKKEMEAAKNPTKSKYGTSFITAMREKRQRRESAREAGLTMEEFQNIEKQYKKENDAGKFSMRGVRRSVDGGAATITEAVPQEKKETKRVENGVEFEQLDSVASTEAVAPNSEAIQQKEEKPVTPDKPAGGILGKIKKFTE